MLTNNQATKIVRRHLCNPNLQLESWSQEQEDSTLAVGRSTEPSNRPELDNNNTPVNRIQGYATDPAAYYLEGTPMPFDIRISLTNEG